jgi:hypothetical protein
VRRFNAAFFGVGLQQKKKAALKRCSFLRPRMPPKESGVETPHSKTPPNIFRKSCIRTPSP